MRARAPARLAAACLLALAAPARGLIGPLSHRIGTHLVLEIWGVAAGVLNDRDGLERALRAASEAAGLTVLEAAFHRFDPQGVTGVLVLSESHISVHTWPELGYAAVDLFSCGRRRELPCSESLARSGGGGEVTMHLRGQAAAAAEPLADWTCADGSQPTSGVDAVHRSTEVTALGGGGVPRPHPLEHNLHVAAAAGDERTNELKDLWAAVNSLVRSLRPSDVQLRRFERGIPATRPP